MPNIFDTLPDSAFDAAVASAPAAAQPVKNSVFDSLSEDDWKQAAGAGKSQADLDAAAQQSDQDWTGAVTPLYEKRDQLTAQNQAIQDAASRTTTGALTSGEKSTLSENGELISALDEATNGKPEKFLAWVKAHPNDPASVAKQLINDRDNPLAGFFSTHGHWDGGTWDDFEQRMNDSAIANRDVNDPNASALAKTGGIAKGALGAVAELVNVAMGRNTKDIETEQRRHAAFSVIGKLGQEDAEKVLDLSAEYRNQLSSDRSIISGKESDPWFHFQAQGGAVRGGFTLAQAQEFLGDLKTDPKATINKAASINFLKKAGSQLPFVQLDEIVADPKNVDELAKRNALRDAINEQLAKNYGVSTAAGSAAGMLGSFYLGGLATRSWASKLLTSSEAAQGLLGVQKAADLEKKIATVGNLANNALQAASGNIKANPEESLLDHVAGIAAETAQFTAAGGVGGSVEHGLTSKLGENTPAMAQWLAHAGASATGMQTMGLVQDIMAGRNPGDNFAESAGTNVGIGAAMGLLGIKSKDWKLNLEKMTPEALKGMVASSETSLTTKARAVEALNRRQAADALVQQAEAQAASLEQNGLTQSAQATREVAAAQAEKTKSLSDLPDDFGGNHEDKDTTPAPEPAAPAPAEVATPEPQKSAEPQPGSVKHLDNLDTPENRAGVPAEVLAAKDQGRLVGGWYDPNTGETVINRADAAEQAKHLGITPDERITQIVAHEKVHHMKSTDALFPPEGKSTVEAWAKAIVDQIPADEAAKLTQNYGFDTTTHKGRMDLAEEWLARQAETQGDGVTLADKLIAHFATLIRKFNPGLRITDAEVKRLIQETRDKVRGTQNPSAESAGTEAPVTGQASAEPAAPADGIYEGAGPLQGMHVKTKQESVSGRKRVTVAVYDDEAKVPNVYPRVNPDAPKAPEGKKVVGYLVANEGADGKMTTTYTIVHPNFRRKGIASAMYDMAEEQAGQKLEPSVAQSEDARKFWAARDAANKNLSPEVDSTQAPTQPTTQETKAHENENQDASHQVSEDRSGTPADGKVEEPSSEPVQQDRQPPQQGKLLDAHSRANQFGLPERPDLFENGATPSYSEWKSARSKEGYDYNPEVLYKSMVNDEAKTPKTETAGHTDTTTPKAEEAAPAEEPVAKTEEETSPKAEEPTKTEEPVIEPAKADDTTPAPETGAEGDKGDKGAEGKKAEPEPEKTPEQEAKEAEEARAADDKARTLLKAEDVKGVPSARTSDQSWADATFEGVSQVLKKLKINPEKIGWTRERVAKLANTVRSYHFAFGNNSQELLDLARQTVTDDMLKNSKETGNPLRAKKKNGGEVNYNVAARLRTEVGNERTRLKREQKGEGADAAVENATDSDPNFHEGFQKTTRAGRERMSADGEAKATGYIARKLPGLISDFVGSIKKHPAAPKAKKDQVNRATLRVLSELMGLERGEGKDKNADARKGISELTGVDLDQKNSGKPGPVDHLAEDPSFREAVKEQIILKLRQGIMDKVDVGDLESPSNGKRRGLPEWLHGFSPKMLVELLPPRLRKVALANIEALDLNEGSKAINKKIAADADADPLARALAQAFLKDGENFASEADPSLNSRDKRGNFDTGTRQLSVDPALDRKTVEWIALHEHTHGVLSSKIESFLSGAHDLLSKDDLAALHDLDALRMEALEHPDVPASIREASVQGKHSEQVDAFKSAKEGDESVRKFYGLINLHEFASEALTNKDFQGFLAGNQSKIQTGSITGKVSAAWAKVKAVLRKLTFGGRTVAEDSTLAKAFDRVVDLAQSKSIERQFNDALGLDSAGDGSFNFGVDAKNQVEFLKNWAEAHGHADINALAEKDPKGFKQAAELWRALNPRTEGKEHASFADAVKSVVRKITDRKMSDLDEATAERSGKHQQSIDEANRAQKAITKIVPSEVRQGGISLWIEAKGDAATLQGWAANAKGEMFRKAAEAAQNLTPEEVAVAQSVRASFDRMEQEGNTYDVLKSHKDNYVPHVWDVDKDKPSMSSSARLQNNFKFAKARSFETFADGDAAGFIPKTIAVGKLLPAYMHEMRKVIADRQFVEDVSGGTAADGRPLVTPRGRVSAIDTASGGKAYLVDPRASKGLKDAAGNDIDTSDYTVAMNQPALRDWRWESKDVDGNPIFMHDDLAMHPEMETRIQAMFGKSAIREWFNKPSSGLASVPKAIVRGIDTAQSVMKREMFSLMSPFHQVQEGWHALSHGVNPFFGLGKLDLSKPNQADAVNHGLMLLSDRNGAQHYLEGNAGTGGFLSQLTRKFGGVAGGHVSDVIDGYQHYLFESYIPRLKLSTYGKLLSRNMGLYASELASGKVSDKDVKLITAEQTNAAYGHLNYALLDRNPTMQHIVQLALLAPDFLEARLRLTGQALKTTLGSKAGVEQLKAIAMMAAIQAGMAYTLTKAGGDEWDPKHPFEAVHGDRRYTLRSVPEDIFSALSDTRKFIYGRVNPLMVRGAIQLGTGKNYRGEQTDFLNTSEELLAQYIPIMARSLPGVRDLTETSRQSPISPLEQIAGSFGIHISRKSPITDTYKLAGEWKKAQGIPTDKGVYPTSKFQQLRYALEDGDMAKAAKEWAKLKEEKGVTTGKLALGFNQSVNHPFTGNVKDDVKFKASLTPEQRAVFDEAKHTRHGVLLKFTVLLHDARKAKPLP